MTEKEEHAIILDYLPYGYPLEGKMVSLAQAMGKTHFTLLQLVPRKGITLQPKEEVYIGEGKRDKIYYILGKLPREKLTENSKFLLQELIEEIVEKKAKEFVEFFNIAESINTRLHQLELIPGFGKKHMRQILEARKEKTFVDFADIKKRIPSLPDPKKAIEKRIMEELTKLQRHNLFTK